MDRKLLTRALMTRTVLATLLTVGLGMKGAVAGGNSCHELDLDGKAAGICNAYLFANQCPEQPDKKSCKVLEAQFLEETGYSLMRLAAVQGVEKTVSVNGGKVSLPSVATVSFAEGDLASDTVVFMRLTDDETFSEFVSAQQIELGDDYEALSVGLRVSLSGSVPQGEMVIVNLSMGSNVWGFDASSEEFLVFIAQQQGSEYHQWTSSLTLAEGTDMSDLGEIRFEMPANAFFQEEPLTQIGQEAIIYILKKISSNTASAYESFLDALGIPRDSLVPEQESESHPSFLASSNQSAVPLGSEHGEFTKAKRLTGDNHNFFGSCRL